MRKNFEKTVVVVGHGMVGHRFCEQLVACDPDGDWRIVAFCEEPRAAYDRVGLTQFFAHRDAEKLRLARLDWYREKGIELHVGDRVTHIDRKRRIAKSDHGLAVEYDAVVFATGSYPFVPPMPGIDKKGVFVYRTIEDLERILAYGDRSKSAAVLGGGLLGLEAAKAAYDLGLQTHVVEMAPRLMPRQVDERGSAVLRRKIEELGVHVHLGCATKEVVGNGKVEGLRLGDDSELPVDMVIVSCGIRPRDDLAKACGLEIGERGGIVVDDELKTSDPAIYAVGEVALHRQFAYGLVAPGYAMAEVVAQNLTGGDRTFDGGDLSTKLKLMGVDVASFGDYEAGDDVATAVAVEDPFEGVYRKLLFSTDGQQLLGGVLVGDASDYGPLSLLAKSGDAVPSSPSALVARGGGATLGGVETMADDAQICSCNAVTKGAICGAIRDQELDSVGAVKACTGAGTGCGGCVPLVTDLFRAELAAMGKTVTNHLCEHFSYSRQELFQIVQVKGLRSFEDVLESHGSGDGCEVCKPTVGSILASLWNDHILDHASLQDTNDRALANMQRGGTYSIVPRVPGGEITPDKLIVLGKVAKKYQLYSKITGGQRIDLFGAELHQLPEIWEELIDAGFESGHAYGKALRTVKSCVGSTWCRYGVGDAVGFAVRVEERYRGIRSPHKLKSAVSGCIRECAEAQSKDFGLIATENGWNLYVAGNGGTKPRHADLIAADLDEATAIRLIDRFLMFYIHTADKLMRTSVWVDKMEGGIEHLREVVVEDKLGIAADLERQMQTLVDSYACEWKGVVENPQRRAQFRQFVNTKETQEDIAKVEQRGQARPIDWPRDEEIAAIPLLNGALEAAPKTWISAGNLEDYPANGGRTILHGKTQIAVFRIEARGEWYATQNLCPHKRALVLSRGITGDVDGEPKVACPLHKKGFSLKTGKCLTGENYAIETFPVKVQDGTVLVELPPPAVLDGSLGTERVRIGAPSPAESVEASVATLLAS